MRKIRSRLTILLYVLVIITSFLSVTLFAMVEDGRFLQREQVRFLLFGYAAKDILLLLIALGAVIVLILLTSRTTTNPVRELNRAAREIAAGNFDVTLEVRGRVEELRELEANFNLMAAELRSNDYLRKDFISSASHELKTPLSVIRGYAELLEDPALSPEERADYARWITGESDRLLQLVDNMLRLSRIDTGRITPARETFSLDEQLRRVLIELEPRARAKGLTIEADIAALLFTGDRELLSHVWTNLLENAVRFTPAGGTVSVRLAAQDGAALVLVRDTGIGMPPEVLARIFEQFYQADPARREGSGLGLPLAKRIVELHGGTLRAESAPAAGTTFRVTLPL